MPIDRKALERLSHRFAEKFGDDGTAIIFNFASQSHNKFRHGGAPRSNLLAAYLMERALDTKGRSLNGHYAKLRMAFYQANREDERDIAPPTKEHLHEITKPYLNELKHGTSFKTPSANAA